MQNKTKIVIFKGKVENRIKAIRPAAAWIDPLESAVQFEHNGIGVVPFLVVDHNLLNGGAKMNLKATWYYIIIYDHKQSFYFMAKN